MAMRDPTGAIELDPTDVVPCLQENANRDCVKAWLVNSVSIVYHQFIGNRLNVIDGIYQLEPESCFLKIGQTKLVQIVVKGLCIVNSVAHIFGVMGSACSFPPSRRGIARMVTDGHIRRSH